MWAVVTANPYTIGYGLLMLTVLVYVWRDAELQLVGVALALSWVARTACKVYIMPADRPAALTVPEIGVAFMAYLALIAGRSDALRWVLAACAACIISNVGCAWLSISEDMTVEQIKFWQLVGNLCFGAECLLVGYAGWTARAADRQRRRTALGGAPAAPRLHPGAE